ncbi:type 1 glutamine amidotransferase domain-containing protein [Pokkaliibacter sp. CJK22405]|uniref:type 1 glutamine amidotransferase domain-containing protein n=1 Tax=Pokkaliibacter sp. CJK22405 TaxID=3384615 RepID=UPI0039849129
MSTQTTDKQLNRKKIAVLVTDGFEQIELTSPIKALKEAGATVDIISPKKGQVKGWKFTEWGDSFAVDKALSEANAKDYDGLVLPGGVINPDSLRTEAKAITFTQSFFSDGKPIAAICHGPQLLIETGALQGRTLTSFQSLKTDLKNAGARWEDREVVTDKGLVTSRTPEDLPAFNRKMVEEFREGTHAGQRTL